jgi:hypothetical protein
MSRTPALTLAAVTLAGTAAVAQTPPPDPCAGEAHRQFDFWIGDWEVTQPDGTAAGHNAIESILGGCVLTEEWTSASSGHAGRSVNIYDARSDRWHQTWVDNSGLLLELNGGLEEGRMVLKGEGKARDGKKLQHEIAWTPQPDGTVKQHWRMKKEGDDSWQDAFVGIYRKVE